ncbi:hypothetical protein B4U80_13724 [Leptotrombidium deliense]|uniref:F-box domain-containing protein n=1 Tax=Leptotrombidium deliense TaxID=299467 RepID=A0A443SIJ7_9ACAR|nr:hypothetical protein B4U80_13724 [Leptotrombidium deliense]
MSFDSLPNELILRIISFFGYKDIPAFSLTCHRVHRLCELQLSNRKLLVNACLPDSLQYVRRVTGYSLNKEVTVNVNGFKLLSTLRFKLPNIRILVLKKIKCLNDKNIHFIGEYLKNLTALWLFSIEDVSDNGMTALFGHCSQLQTLGIHYLNINGDCFKNVPLVTHLSLAVCDENTEEIDLNEFAFHSSSVNETNVGSDIGTGNGYGIGCGIGTRTA